ncbi:MAG: ABC transporter permease [Roseiarcus sp.]|uniref:ABC transporter permease n=1 Tax=Roseiarcus sp. TaxID=1969460 RepID=UPI003BB01E55
MAEPRRAESGAVLQVKGLNVYYGRSHALQGVDLTLEHGVLSVVGRNGMGKTTLCKTIMGLVKASGGSVRMKGRDLLGLSPAQIARHGVGYVPQGRRLWRSLTVDEHLRMVAAGQPGAWTVERVYDAFPRLAERKSNGGGQLSGGEQQMLAIARALVTNPELLIMDEPTEGLAPVIVAQVEEMLVRLGAESDIAILVIEQNIGVATSVSENVAIMVNGRVNRIIESRRLAADRDLQQRLLGVGRHSEAEPEPDLKGAQAATRPVSPSAQRPGVAPVKIYVSNPSPPTRWSQPVPNARIESSARTASVGATRLEEAVERRAPTSATQSGPPTVLVVGTLDTKGPELRFIRDIVAGSGLRTRLVDVSTSGKLATCDVTAQEVALNHGRGGSSVFGRERGASVAAMAEAFEAFVRRQSEVVGIIGAGGSGGASIVAPAMRALPIGTPKVLISSVASGDVGRYVGPSDITMMYSVTDVQGLNRISRQVLANGAQALVGMVKARLEERKTDGKARSGGERPAVGLTMFGVTTPCVQQVAKALEGDWECLVFHATGVGGRSMEKLIDSGLLTGVVDITTTEVADMLMGGVFPADEDRFGAVIRTRTPYVGSVGALDMVNFGAPETAPAAYKGRLMHAHNPQVTLMRTTRDENDRMGRWIGERLNRMDGPVRFLLPELGVSALDAAGEPFWDPDADAALFKALEQTVRQTANRQLVRVRRHINDPEFAAAVVETFRALHGQAGGRRRAAR